VALSTLISASNSDLTLSRIIPHIDGIASVAHIAEQADVDLLLCRKAVSHLVYYNCVLLLDIFTFAAQYAVTPEFTAFVEDEEGQEEGLGYVTVGQYRRLTEAEKLADSRSHADGKAIPNSVPAEKLNSMSETWGWKPGESSFSKSQLVEMYASFRQGVSLRSWCLERQALLAGLDVRRLVTFGVIKGFLYRCHRYAILDNPGTPLAESELARSKMLRRRILARKARGPDIHAEKALELEVQSRRLSRPGSIAAATHKNLHTTGANGEEESGDEEIPLMYYLDGQHCFDEICTDLSLPEPKAMDKMKQWNAAVTFITR
jgi:hypothetical protein